MSTTVPMPMYMDASYPVTVVPNRTPHRADSRHARGDEIETSVVAAPLRNAGPTNVGTPCLNRSFEGHQWTERFAVGRRGLEPRTLGLKVPCSTR